jgi:TetR/AcrR family transcriptional regulator
MTILNDKKEQILAAAEVLFAENGFSGTTTRMLAAKAGVNLGMLTYYFGTKEQIFEALVEKRITGFASVVQEAILEGKDEFEALDNMIDAYFNYFSHRPTFHRCLYREMSLAKESSVMEFAIQNIMKNRQKLADFIEKGIEKGKFRKVDVYLTISTFTSLLFHTIQTENFAMRMMNENPETDSIRSERIQTRLKTFIKDFLHRHLMP